MRDFCSQCEKSLATWCKNVYSKNVRKPEPSFGRIRDIENIREDENNGREF